MKAFISLITPPLVAGCVILACICFLASIITSTDAPAKDADIATILHRTAHSNGVNYAVIEFLKVATNLNGKVAIIFESPDDIHALRNRAHATANRKPR